MLLKNFLHPSWKAGHAHRPTIAAIRDNHPTRENKTSLPSYCVSHVVTELSRRIWMDQGLINTVKLLYSHHFYIAVTLQRKTVSGLSPQQKESAQETSFLLETESKTQSLFESSSSWQ